MHIIQRLEEAGVKLRRERTTAKELPLNGFEFVITGKLEGISREEAHRRIKASGGSTRDNITKKTSYLVVGTEPGSKLTKASKQGIKQIGEEELRRLLEKG